MPRAFDSRHWEEDETMLFTLAVVLVVLWATGFLAFHVSSGLIHLLLFAAVVAIIFQLVSGRRTI
jgi:uncharacterized protein DUF5670